MRVLILRCGDFPLPSVPELSVIDGAEVHQLPAIPSRRDLRFLDEAAASILPTDPTPSLDEITSQPDVEHLGTPALAPQSPHLPERLRIIVVGSDAALSAVITRMMRADYLWAEVGFVAADTTTAGRNWGLPGDPSEALRFARSAPVNPAPLIRSDTGLAVAGSATISEWDGGEITSEIIVDDHVLLRHEGNPEVRFDGFFGARLVPMTDAPGIVAVRSTSPVPSSPMPAEYDVDKRSVRERLGGYLNRVLSPFRVQKLSLHPLSAWLFRGVLGTQGRLDADSLATGRAVQAGGPALAVTIDGVRHKRSLERVTFYRHLRDLQIVRP